jgi:DNA-binding CsgD family transcriptional regulator
MTIDQESTVQPLQEVGRQPNRQAVSTALHSSTGAWTALLADPTQELTHTLHRGMLHAGARNIVLAHSADQVDDILGQRPGTGELAVVSARFGLNADPIIRKLRRARWNRVLIFAPVHSATAIISAFDAGATGVLSWPTVYAQSASAELTLDLSDTEKDVLSLVATGASNRQIGIQLGVSTATIAGHLAHISDVIGTGNRSHMVTIALRAGAIKGTTSFGINTPTTNSSNLMAAG